MPQVIADAFVVGREFIHVVVMPVDDKADISI